MWKKILGGAGVAFVLFLAFIQTRPAEFHIERSLQMNAPAATVFGYIDDFHKWSLWSPWDKLDPSMKREYSGASSGVGAAYGWTGNDQVGSGKMTITETMPPEMVKIALDFLTPFEAHNRTTFSIRSAGSSSTVTWMMDGENGFMGKAASVFMDMDQLVGKDFETGLASIKQAAEADAKTQTAETEKKAVEAKVVVEAPAPASAAPTMAASASAVAVGAGGAAH